MIAGNPQEIISQNTGDPAYRGERVEYLHVTHDGAPSNYSIYRVTNSRGLEYVSSPPSSTRGLPYEGDYQIAISTDKRFSAIRTNAVSALTSTSSGYSPSVMVEWYGILADTFTGASGWLSSGTGHFVVQDSDKFGYSSLLGRYWRTTDLTPSSYENDVLDTVFYTESPSVIDFGPSNWLIRSNGSFHNGYDVIYQRFGTTGPLPASPFYWSGRSYYSVDSSGKRHGGIFNPQKSFHIDTIPSIDKTLMIGTGRPYTSFQVIPFTHNTSYSNSYGGYIGAGPGDYAVASNGIETFPIGIVPVVYTDQSGNQILYYKGRLEHSIRKVVEVNDRNLGGPDVWSPGHISIHGDFAAIAHGSQNSDGNTLPISVWKIFAAFSYPYQYLDSPWTIRIGNNILNVPSRFAYKEPGNSNNTFLTNTVGVPGGTNGAIFNTSNCPLLVTDSNGVRLVKASCLQFSPTGTELVIGTRNSVNGSPYVFAYKWATHGALGANTTGPLSTIPWGDSPKLGSNGGLANGFDVPPPSWGAPLGYNITGWGLNNSIQYSSPAVPVPGRVKVIKFALGSANTPLVIIAHENAPHISVYRWSANGFGEKLPDCPELIAFAAAAGKTDYVRSIAI